MQEGRGDWAMDIGRVFAMVSAVKCVSLMIHTPVPLGQIIHYILIKITKKIHKTHHLRFDFRVEDKVG